MKEKPLKMNHIKVLLFASLRDYAGARSLELDIPDGTTVQALIDILVGQYPRLEIVKDSMMTAIDRKYAGDKEVIPLNAEVAFFPPVSGG